MIVRAVARNVRISPQKVMIILNSIRKRKLNEAINFVSFSNKKASFIIKKLLMSVMANAEHNYSLDIDSLFICCIYVGAGSTLKRFKPRAKGRSNTIIKRSSHIFVEVKEGK